MIRPRTSTLLLAALTRACAVLIAFGLLVVLIDAGARAPAAADASAVAAELVEDEPEAAPSVQVATRGPVEIHRPAPRSERSWASQMAPPPIVPPPER